MVKLFSLTWSSCGRHEDTASDFGLETAPVAKVASKLYPPVSKIADLTPSQPKGSPFELF